MEGLNLRPYVQGRDDGLLNDIYNAASAGTPDFVPGTLEELRIEQQAPDWTAEGRFFAEIDGRPVGTTIGFKDPHRDEPVGFLGGPHVLPGFRRRGVGTALAERALEFLRTQKLERVRAWAEDWNEDARAFLDRLGFEPVRRFSLMRRPLAGLPSGIGESREAEIAVAGTTDEDAALLTRLSNAAFREHFGHRDDTIEERTFWMRNMAALGFEVRRTVARLEGSPVGFLTLGFSPRDNEELGVKRGGLWSLGVLEPHRNRGVGRALMLEGMRWLAGQGMDEVELGVDDDNKTRARNLYERLGFELVRSHRVYERALGPALRAAPPA